METPAVLVNNLLLKLKCAPGEKGLSESDVEDIFAKTQEMRFASAVAAMEQGRQTTAASIKDTFTSRIFVDWFFPYFGQSLIMHFIVKNTESGKMIDVLPIPNRYTDAIQNQMAMQAGKASRRWKLASLGSACLALTYLCIR